MRERFFLQRAALAAVLAGALCIPGFAARTDLEKPYLSAELQEKLQSLPYGLADQKSLFLRFRHVASVQFFGAGTRSRFSFKRGQSVVNEGLSMRLVPGWDGTWATGVVQLKRPMDVSRYNSLLIWAWASRPHMRVWATMKGGAQVRTDALPTEGFPANEPVQLVIPFNRFSPKGRINLSAVSQIGLEFGSETTGNPPRSAIQILGFAFVQQTEPTKRALVVLGRERSRVVLAEPTHSDVPDDMDDLTATPATDSGAAPVVEPTTFDSMKEWGGDLNAFAATVFRKLGLDFSRPTVDLSNIEAAPAPAPIDVAHHAVDAQDTAADAPPAGPFPSGVVGYLSMIAALSVFWWYLRRRTPVPPVERLGKVLHEVHWPFATTQPGFNKRVEREFWHTVSARQERYAWLSTTGLVIERPQSAEYFGEAFLKRQIKCAAREGVRLIPSLSFTNTLFRKDTSISSFERSSSALHALVTQTLTRFADVAGGVRIEDATALITTKLRRKGRKPVDDEVAAEVAPAERDFWSEVINEVKSKHPGFLFIADSAGDKGQPLREVGFDFYENDMLARTVLEQVRDGKVGDLAAFLRGEASALLKRSVYNLNSIVKPSVKRDADRHQQSLAAIILTLLPGVVQHDNNIPEDLSAFVNRMARSSAISKGKFALLPSSDASVLAFARWRKKTLILAIANFASEPRSAMISLRLLQEGFENNKLYLFNNAMHGSSTLKNLLNQPESGGPALALWGQSLRDTGLPLSLPGVSLSLFSVALSRPIGTNVPSSEPPTERPEPALK